jgi:hypothetical protein
MQNSLLGSPDRALSTNVNGASWFSNTTKVDGILNVYAWIPTHTAYVPPVESVDVVNISTSNFDAEQGNAGGAAVNVVTKSGTNQFHAVVFGYHSNSAISARNVFYFQPVIPKNIQNQYGATVAGPVKKDKLFFFTSFEGMKQRQSYSSTPTVATAAQRTGDFSGISSVIYDPLTGAADGKGRTPFTGNKIPTNRLSSISLKMQGLVPLPNMAGTASNYFVSAPLVFDRNNYDIKGNWNPSGNLSLWAKYGAMTATVISAPTLGEAGGNGLGGGTAGSSDDLVQAAGIGASYTVSAHFIIDGNAGYSRISLNQYCSFYGKNLGLDLLGIPGTNGSDVRQSGYPAFSITGYEPLGLPDTTKPAFYNDDTLGYNLNAGWIRGPHNVRFGLSLDRRRLNHWQPQISGGPRGTFAFAGGVTALNGGAAPTQFNAYAQFLLGLPGTVSKSLQYLSPMSTREWADGLYIRDQWQVTRKLALSYGLRWELYPVMTTAHTGFQRYDLATNKVVQGGIGGTDNGITGGHKLFAPRVGIAYRFTNHTIVRAGYGITIDPASWPNAVMLIYPAVIGQSQTSGSTYLAYNRLEDGIPPFTLVGLDQGVIPIAGTIDTTTVPAGEWSRGRIESYNFTLQHEFPHGLVADLGYVGTRQVHIAASYQANAGLVPGAGAAGQPLNVKFGRTASTNVYQPSPYDSGMYHSLQARLNRRFSNGFMVTVSYTWSKTMDWSDNGGGLMFNIPDALPRNRAVAGFDRTQNLWASSVWQLPFGRGKRWLADRRWAEPLVSNWQINGVFSAYSGTPFSVGASATSLNAPSNSQVADQVKTSFDYPKQMGAGQYYFDPTAFAAVTQARFGNSGRNEMRGPGQVNLDLGLFRAFRAGEKLVIQFRAEAFNSTNTPHFNNPNATVGSATFATVTSAKSDQRFLRLALRLSF